MTDLHVLDDLGHPEGQRPGPPRPAPATGRQDHTPADLKATLDGDGAVDVARIALTTAVLNLGADRVQFDCQRRNVCLGQTGQHRHI
ncbi:hypothetical protein [Mycobacterium riyadhense]|uniref:hypothetical protein n=1 Tax=Mycobacterium riyadhense TaxID=486698 RepID=UPI0021F35E15|nr:hypothetical protein [Mycobacterium riyadhense]MCV7146218.1 hypothetical protein [Mycobacterium riyadhense]